MEAKVQNTFTRGFTIVELLIVIVVIGILAAITIVAFSGVQNKARIAVVQSDLSGAVTQLGSESVTTGAYPSTLAVANNGQGLRGSPGTTYQYTYTAVDNTYCLTATNGNLTYYVSSANTSPTTGVCVGHTVPGAPVNGAVVTTLAGSVSGYLDATGTAAQFKNPGGIAIDSTGTLYVSDYSGHRIRKVTSAGVVTTLAGSGVAGFSNATGTAAQFSTPQGLAVDSTGNVFVADTANNKIRKITPAGVVTTFAGSTFGFTNGTGTAAQFGGPTSLSIDSAGNLYVADYNNHAIRKITSAGVVTTFAGSATSGALDGTGTAAQFYYPSDVSIDSSGNIYVADTFNYRIRKITPAGVVSTIAGSSTGYVDASGAAAKFNQPRALTVDSSGTIYVADTSNNVVRKITPAGVVTTLAGSTSGTNGSTNATGTAARFFNPQGIVSDSAGTLYVSDFNNYIIRKIQ